MKKVALIAGALVLGVTSIAVASTRDAAVPKASLTSTVKVHDGKPLGAHSVGHVQLKNSVIDCEKLVPSLRSAVCSLSLISNSVKGDKGDSGPNGSNGVDGKNGADGKSAKGDRGDGQILVDANTPGIQYSNPSVKLGANGIHYGPYTNNDAGDKTSGGSVNILLPAGTRVKDLANLEYTASYNNEVAAPTNDGDAPYFRVFIDSDKDGAVDHDIVFSPSTQPGGCAAYGQTDALVSPALPHGPQCASDGRTIHYNVTEGTVRYDDDAGDGPDVWWNTLVSDPSVGNGPVMFLKVSTGNSLPGTHDALLNSVTYEVAGSNPTTLAFAH